MSICAPAFAEISNTSKIFDIQLMHLNNNIPVITHQHGDNDLFSIHLVADIGLQDFPCEDRQLPHVVEHVLFEETRSFDGPSLRRRIFNNGYWEGYTKEEYTHYTMHVHKRFSDIAIDTLYRMMSEPTLSERATANAIRSVNTEMGTSQGGMLQNWINDSLSLKEQGINRLYPNTNLACTKRQTPNHITQTMVEQVYKDHYVPENYTLFVIGQFDEAELLKSLNDTFGKIPESAAKQKTPLVEKEIDYTPIVEKEKYGDPSTYLKIFVRADGKGESSQLAWKLISLYLTEKTFAEIRTKRGIGYTPKVRYDAGTEIGHLILEVRTTSEWYDQAEALALDIFKDLKINGIPEKDFERLKNRMLYEFESKERTHNNLFQLYRHNRQYIKDTGKMRNLIEEIKTLSPQLVTDTIARMPDKPLIAILRPNSFFEALLKVFGLVAVAALLALPILRRKHNKKALDS
ncbi:MAG: insulinase family protein [Pseudomonadales bacterium]|nr:insulinase family protein [Pseudomonadales bacterium]